METLKFIPWYSVFWTYFYVGKLFFQKFPKIEIVSVQNWTRGTKNLKKINLRDFLLQTDSLDLVSVLKS